MAIAEIQNQPAIDLQDYGENIAAICEIIYSDQKSFRYIIEKIGSEICGSAGIWDLCARAGRIFTEESQDYLPGEKYEWFPAIEDYSCKLHDELAHGKIPDDSKMHLMAGGSIESNFI